MLEAIFAIYAGLKTRLPCKWPRMEIEYLRIDRLNSVLVSYCCCNKSPLIQWLKMAQIYELAVLEVRIPKWASEG